jgi:tripartite-type tricarboxylate transporter receptor subunit TctC
MEPAIVKKLHDAFKEALYDAATQAVMEKFSMPTLYQDAAAYQADYKELEAVERENLKRVGLLAKPG